MKKTVSAVEARQKLGELLEGVHYRDDEVVIERAGKVMAVLVPAWRYENMERSRARFFETVDRIHEHNKDVPYEVIQADVDKAVAEVRAEFKARRGAV